MKKTVILALCAALCLFACSAHALTLTGLEVDHIERQWENHAFFGRMQALTGVQMQAHGISDQAEYADLLEEMEKGSAAYDVLFKAALTRDQEIALADSGAIVDLAPYIGEHMPNLKALLDAYPEWKESISLDDGRIVALPLLNLHERQTFMWINRTWIERLGMEMPQTIDELTAVLAAMKERDPNGNGRKDEQPLDLLGVYEMRWLLPYFGVVADDYHLARDAGGAVVFAPQLPGYRDFIAQLKRWYDEGLLPRDAFFAMHNTETMIKSEEETATSGMMLTATPYTHVPVEKVMEYEPLLLAGPDGAVRWRDLLGEVWTGCFAVTSACDDVPSALRWADALYGEAGALLAHAGVEGEDYSLNEEGAWSFQLDGERDIDDIRADSVIYTGAAVPGLYPADFVFRVDSDADRHVFEASERVRAVSERVAPVYALSYEKQKRADALAAALCELVDRGIVRFVTGEIPLEDETYTAWLDEMAAAGSAELAALYTGL